VDVQFWRAKPKSKHRMSESQSSLLGCSVT
jgi:hypothetical protein